MFQSSFQQRISDARQAAAVAIDVPGSDSDLFQVFHTHKGECHDEAEKKLGGRAKCGWTQLDMYLLQLTENVKLPPDKLAGLKKVLTDL